MPAKIMLCYVRVEAVCGYGVAAANEAKLLCRHDEVWEAGAFAHGAVAFIDFELCWSFDLDHDSSAVTTTYMQHDPYCLALNAAAAAEPRWRRFGDCAALAGSQVLGLIVVQN